MQQFDSGFCTYCKVCENVYNWAWGILYSNSVHLICCVSICQIVCRHMQRLHDHMIIENIFDETGSVRDSGAFKPQLS